MNSNSGTTHFDSLLDRLRRGDYKAKKELVRDVYSRVKQSAHLYLEDNQNARSFGIDSDALANTSLIKFWKKVEGRDWQIPETSAGLFSYIDRVIRNAVVDEIRSKRGPKNQVQFPSLPLTQEIEDKPVSPLERLALAEVLHKLDEDQQSLIDHHFFALRSLAEIAEILHISKKDARTRISAALRRLREFLSESASEIRST